MSNTKEKPRIGRPPIADELRLKKRWIRATDAQWELWNKAGGDNLNHWIRDTLNRSAKRRN